MKHFLVSYKFKGMGDVTIKAQNKKEAKAKFYKGKGWGPEIEMGENYSINKIEKVSNKYN